MGNKKKKSEPVIQQGDAELQRHYEEEKEVEKDG